jgi:hypothetical protein
MFNDQETASLDMQNTIQRPNLVIFRLDLNEEGFVQGETPHQGMVIVTP